MVKSCAGPVRCTVARLACRRERPGDVVRYRSALRRSRIKVGLMAVNTSCRLRGERRHRMTLVARSHCSMRTGKCELRL